MHSCYRPKRSFGQGNIFTSVCLSTGGGVFFGGFLQIFGGVSFLRGGSSKFLGGFLQIFGGVFFWGGVLPRNTVNVRPVRILLECILVIYCSCSNCFGVTAAVSESDITFSEKITSRIVFAQNIARYFFIVFCELLENVRFAEAMI